MQQLNNDEYLYSLSLIGTSSSIILSHSNVSIYLKQKLIKNYSNFSLNLSTINKNTTVEFYD
jgi:hypothetical protein